MDQNFRQIENLWTIHSYYTISPWAPDNSGRLLLAGTDRETQDECRLGIFDRNGSLIHNIPGGPVIPSFWHTGKWQCWGPDSRYIYHQDGTFKEPKTTRVDLITGDTRSVSGDLEGIPPQGEPGLSGSHNLLYAAGYGDHKFKPEAASVPFMAREKHGISRISFNKPESLVLSTEEVLASHPKRDWLKSKDRILAQKWGQTYKPAHSSVFQDGLTLMTYAVRWNQQGSRFLFYFGNHCVVKERGEPRLAYIFTSNKDMTDIRLALDLSEDKRGLHWSWHPDGERLIGYGPDPGIEGSMCLAFVNYDGSDYKKISSHCSGGHPSVNPTDHSLIVSDESSVPGRVVFIDSYSGETINTYPLKRCTTNKEVRGRNPERVCLHPVFSPDGKKVLVNTLSAGRFHKGRAIPLILNIDSIL